MTGVPYSEVEDFLEHYGVLGMKWGVRKDRGPQGVSGRTSREAKKDAQEYARAKMFYGEGAGTRRKLINKSVEAKAKRDPSYKKAFDFHLERQDMSKHASKARSERSRKDKVNYVGKTARGLKSMFMGPFAPTLTVLAITYGVNEARKRGYDKKVAQWGQQAYNNIKRDVRAMQIKEQFRKGGWKL